MDIQTTCPWEDPALNRYVADHPGGTVYHTSEWCSIVADIGRYKPICLVARSNADIRGLLPLMLVKSALTGTRIVALPFSDVCPPLVDDAATAETLVRDAQHLAKQHRATYLEIRGIPRLRTEKESAAQDTFDGMGFSRQSHFKNYVIPLSKDTAAIKKTFHKSSVRQTINQSIKRGAAVRLGQGQQDLDEFYRLYAMNRKRHGIPPQPRRLFTMIFERMNNAARAALYIVETEGRAVAGLIVFQYQLKAYAKYEGVDETSRNVMPVYPLLWKSIEDAALRGDTTYDFGRTAVDNTGLNAFKNRWGTVCSDIHYFFYPPSEGLSVIGSGSLKYRLFTGAIRRLPLPIVIRLGAKIFRHFG